MPSIRSEYSSSLDFFGEAGPAALAAEFGSPLYVYNEKILRERCREMANLADQPGFKACYSTKANSNPHLLRIIRSEGLLADAMSPGELAVLQKAGFGKEEICYVCNNVSDEELKLAGQSSARVSLDSLSQLDSFGRIMPGSQVMVRVNPGIGAGHHDKVVTAGKNTKFGVEPEDFAEMRAILKRHDLKLVGLNQHVGSLFMDAGPYLAAAEWLLDTARDFPEVSVIDFGGGFGIPYYKYEGQNRLDIAEFKERFSDLLRKWSLQTGFGGQFIVEPGRYVSAESSILLGTAHAIKNNGHIRYVGTDLGFNVLARPVMYDAYHDVEIYSSNNVSRDKMAQTIVGNICESGDILAKNRVLPEIVKGDILGVLDAGAYGLAMSSNYNLRLRPAEVLINEDGSHRLIRRRDSIEDLLAVIPE